MRKPKTKTVSWLTLSEVNKNGVERLVFYYTHHEALLNDAQCLS